MTDSLTSETDYGYNALDSLTSVTEGIQTRTFNYNSLSELYSETQPESGTTNYYYMSSSGSRCSADLSQVCRRTDARGITTTYSYDADNRLTGKTYSDSEPAVSYGYDGVGGAAACPSGHTCYDVGQRTSMTDGSGNSLWAYDSMGRTLSKQQTVGTTAGTTVYSYYLDGEVYTLTYPRSARTLTYSLNGAEQETQLHDLAGQVTYVGLNNTDATYAPQGALATMANGNGVVFTETYDTRLRPSTINAALNSTNILNLAYNYDGDSNVTQLAQTNVAANENYTGTFGYDALNRLYSASSALATVYTQQFGYDGTTTENDPGGRYGNVSCTSASGPPCAVLTFDLQHNRIASIGTRTPTYDAAGEMTSDGTGTGTTQYTWNAEGRTATVTPTGGATATYVYDGDGNRVEDTAANRIFWYSGPAGLLEMTDAGSVNHDYIYFTGRRIARYDSSGGVNYLYDDANGSLRTMTDASGNVQCWADYYAFGEPAGTGCSGENYQFAGLYSDPYSEDGGHSAAHRRYNDTYYRWLSPDPGGRKVVKLDNPQTWNMYAYVTNNPTSLNDPSGLCGQSGPMSDNPGQCRPLAAAASKAHEDWRSFVRDLSSSTQTLHYKKNVPPASAALKKMLGCTQDCVGSQLTITSTTDRVRDKNGKVVAHSTNTPHGRGEAADIRANRRNASNILACGAGCGAEFGLNEVAHPSKYANGPHVHLSVTPGRNGGRRDLPPALMPSHLVPDPEPPHPVSDHRY